MTPRGILYVLLLAAFLAAAWGFAGEPGSSSDPLVTKSFLEEAYGWRVTTVPAGEKLVLDLGSEAVLRSGKAVVLGTKAGGLADLTLGEDLPDGVLVPANHYLISASGDGRGVRALSTTVFLTRGLVR